MMMRMLEAGGMSILADASRAPDSHNPHGYFEYKRVKYLARDTSWMRAADGRAVKITYHLLRYLPSDISYRVLFMERNWTELFESQRDMLISRGDPAATQPADRIIRALSTEVERSKAWLDKQPNFNVLTVPYAEVLRRPEIWSHKVSLFLDRDLNEALMAITVDPSLYRHRHRAGQ